MTEEEVLEEKRKKVQEKYKDMKVFHEFPGRYLGTSRNRQCIVRIQQSTPKAPIMVRFQEMYCKKDEPGNWKYGRAGISIPVETYLEMCDPYMNGPIGKMINDFGFADVDEEGLRELQSLSVEPVEVVEQPVPHNICISGPDPDVTTQWLQWFMKVTNLKDLVDPRIDRSTPGTILIKNLPLTARIIKHIEPHYGQGLYWEQLTS